MPVIRVRGERATDLDLQTEVVKEWRSCRPVNRQEQLGDDDAAHRNNVDRDECASSRLELRVAFDVHVDVRIKCERACFSLRCE